MLSSAGGHSFFPRGHPPVTNSQRAGAATLGVCPVPSPHLAAGQDAVRWGCGEPRLAWPSRHARGRSWGRLGLQPGLPPHTGHEAYLGQMGGPGSCSAAGSAGGSGDAAMQFWMQRRTFLPRSLEAVIPSRVFGRSRWRYGVWSRAHKHSLERLSQLRGASTMKGVWKASPLSKSWGSWVVLAGKIED